MRNIEYTLKDVIPDEIRLETYKIALEYYLTPDKDKKDWGHGLCLVLPCALWDLKNFMNDHPGNYEDWDYWDTRKAFPEIKEAVDYITDFKFQIFFDEEKLPHLRIEAIRNAIEELKNKLKC